MSLPAQSADAFKRFALDASVALRGASAFRLDDAPMPKRLWRTVFFGALVMLAAVQYAYFFGAGGRSQAATLTEAVATQKALNLELRARNAQLKAEVFDLRDGEDAIEERARGELGLIRTDETFYQVVDLDSPESDAR
jgi:cell division protein FtsB